MQCFKTKNFCLVVRNDGSIITLLGELLQDVMLGFYAYELTYQ